MKIFHFIYKITTILTILLASSCVEVRDLLPSMNENNDEPKQNRNMQALRATANPAEKRVALVIGNGDYHYAGKLANPPHDAQSLADTLGQLGFIVIHKENLDKTGLNVALREFSQALQGASLGLFFYAGHGGRYQKENYLISVKANIKSREKTLLSELFALDSVLEQMENARVPTKIIILDACRNNPFEDKGLAEVKSRASYNGGTFIAYSTQPGNVAKDGSGYNSPYTESLLEFIQQPNKPIEILFRDVRTTVKQKTYGEQIPWDESSLDGGDLCLAGCFASTQNNYDYCTTKLDQGLYQGQCADNLPHGQGVMRYSSGEYYEGSFVHGLRDGYGIQYLTDGTELKGEFCAGKICKLFN